MATGIISLLAILLPFAIEVLRKWAEQRVQDAPRKRDEEIDRAFNNPDPTVRAGELQSLDDQLRRAETGAAARQQSPPP